MSQDKGSEFKVQGSESVQNVEHDTPMTSTYVQVLVLEAVILVALWIFGRMFS